MKKGTCLALVVALSGPGVLGACAAPLPGGDRITPDAGETARDGGETARDGGSTARDGGSPPEATSYAQTNGGGRVASPTHAATIVIGGAVPVGRAATSRYRAYVGTSPARSPNR